MKILILAGLILKLALALLYANSSSNRPEDQALVREAITKASEAIAQQSYCK